LWAVDRDGTADMNFVTMLFMGKPKKSPPPSPAPLAPESASKPLVFISHDHRDAALADAFSQLLTKVSAGMLKSFRSSDKTGEQGLEYGEDWYRGIMERLDGASDVVCILTQRSVDRPWILYEAGIANGKLAQRVKGLVLGMPMSTATRTGPFAALQNCDGDPKAVAGLVMQLCRRIPGLEPDADSVNLHVQQFLDSTKQILSADGGASVSPAKKPEQETAAKLFEEVKVMFQELGARMDGRMADADYERRHRHPMATLRRVDVIAHEAGDSLDPQIAWVLVMGMLRHDVPWLVDLLQPIGRAIESRNRRKFENAVRNFEHTLERIQTTDIVEAMAGNRMPAKMLTGPIRHLIQRIEACHKFRSADPASKRRLRS
jgi:hypothetical protein